MEPVPPSAGTAHGRTRGTSASSSASSASTSRPDASRTAALIGVPLLAQHPNPRRTSSAGERRPTHASTAPLAGSAEAGPSSLLASGPLSAPLSTSHKGLLASPSASPASRVNAGTRRPRGTYASRTCLQCRQRKAKCKLPEEALRVPSSLEELPIHLRCARCAEHGFGCIVWDPEGRGKRKRGASSTSEAPTAAGAALPTAAALQPDPTILGMSAPRTTAMPQARAGPSSLDLAFAEPSFADTSEGAPQHRPHPASLRFYMGPHPVKPDVRQVAGGASGLQHQQRYRSSTSASSSRYPVSVDEGAEDRYQQASVSAPGHAAALASSRPQPGAELDLNAFLDGMTESAPYHPAGLPMPPAHEPPPSVPSIAMQAASSPAAAGCTSKPDTPLEALSRFLAHESACAVSPFRDTGPPASGANVLSLVSTELSARLETIAHAFILWHPHLPSLRTLRQQHAQSASVGTSLLLTSLYALALPELAPQPHGALQLVASLHALIRRDAALLYSDADASIEAVQALDLLSVHMPLALLPSLPRGPSRDAHAFQGTSLAELAGRLARKLGLPDEVDRTTASAPATHSRTDPRALLWCTLVSWRETLSANVELGSEFDSAVRHLGDIAARSVGPLPPSCTLAYEDVPLLRRAGEGLLLLRLQQLQHLKACQRRCEQIFEREPFVSGLNLAMFQPTLSRCSFALTDVRNATLKRLGPIDAAKGPLSVAWHSVQLEVEMSRLLLLGSISAYAAQTQGYAPSGSSAYAQDRLALKNYAEVDFQSDEVRDMQAQAVWSGVSRFNSLVHASLEGWLHFAPSAVVALPVLSTCSFLHYAARFAVSQRMRKPEAPTHENDPTEQASVLQTAARHVRACDGFVRRNEHGSAHDSIERGSIWSATADALDKAAATLTAWPFASGASTAQARSPAEGPSSDFRQELASVSPMAGYNALPSGPHASHMSGPSASASALSSGVPQAAFHSASATSWPEVWNLDNSTTHLGAGVMGTPLPLQQPHYPSSQTQQQQQHQAQLLQQAHRHHQQHAGGSHHSHSHGGGAAPDPSQELALTPDAQLAQQHMQQMQQQAVGVPPPYPHPHTPRNGVPPGDRWMPQRD